jgi:hypothetical protein
MASVDPRASVATGDTHHSRRDRSPRGWARLHCRTRARRQRVSDEDRRASDPRQRAFHCADVACERVEAVMHTNRLSSGEVRSSSITASPWHVGEKAAPRDRLERDGVGGEGATRTI